MSNSTSIDTNGSWQKQSGKTFEINGFSDGSTIYARLTDGINSSKMYATLNASSGAKQSYTISEFAQNTNRASFDILAISASSNEIRVQIDGQKDEAKLYSYYYKTINDDEYTLISTSTYGYDPAVITNIKEGTIYQIKATYIDSSGNVQRSQNTATVIALDSATTGQTYTNNRTYIDESKDLDVSKTAGTGKIVPNNTETVTAGYTITLPESFKVSSINGETKQTEGAVLQDGNGNEYVWIPINDAIYDNVTGMPTSSSTASRTYKPMAKQNKDGYYESLIYTFNGTNSWQNSNHTGLGTSGYREPSLITGNSSDGYTWNLNSVLGTLYDAKSDYYSGTLGFSNVSEFGKYMQSNYTNMILSADSFGGFYVGRYETTKRTDSNGNIIIGSKANEAPISLANWYNLYLYQDSNKYLANPYNAVSSVVSSMIWQSQYDAMLNYILTGNDNSKVTTHVGTQKGIPSNSGQDNTDKINNIYDLGSNLYEFTQEANGTDNRVIRGGSYDASKKLTPSDKTADIATDSGEGIGSRLALYTQSTNDVTGPSSKITSISTSSNNISVEVSAIDKESGVANYNYYISEDGKSYTLAKTTSSNSYTYTGLKNSTKYYIRVSSTDKSGNTGGYADGTATTTALGNIASSAITLESIVGTNGKGRATLSLKDEYSNSGYYIEYQAGATMSATWTKGNVVEGLQNGDFIYATVYDGVNRSTDHFEYEVAGLEQFDYYVDGSGNSTQNTTVKYKDAIGNEAYIPKGFKVGITNTINKVTNGLVVQDESGNEFVWVPVSNAIETNTSKTSTEKAMARLQSGYKQTDSQKYYEGIRYNFNGQTSSKKYSTPIIGTASAYGEPRLVTGGADYSWNIAKSKAKGTSYDTIESFYKYMDFGSSSGVNAFNSYTEFGNYMNEQYTNMVKSVDNFGGFYVGRYETSYGGSGKNMVAKTQLGLTPVHNQNWYVDYYCQDSNLDSVNPYYNNSGVTSSMIWGSQWDAILNWMLSDSTTADFPTKPTGNHSGKIATSGSDTTDLAKNIYDMASNVAEWTQGNGASNTTYRAKRGGYAVASTDRFAGNFSASSDFNLWNPPTDNNTPYRPENTTYYRYDLMGTRMSLYINNETDNTAPNLIIDSVEAGTNNINVNVTATDEESGMQSYMYTLYNDSSYTNIAKQIKAYSSNYNIDGLTQNQTYYLRIQAFNGSGKSTTKDYGSVKTLLLNVQEGTIVREKTWGKNGAGKIYCTISNDDLKNEGYYIEYQDVKSGGTFNANGTWTKSDTPSKLSEGDVVYLRLSDGVNKSTYMMTVNIGELEKFSSSYTETAIYNDYDTDPSGNKTLVGTAYIPKGFKVATSSITNKISNGLVIEDENENQYVWIPVKNAIYNKNDGTIPNNSTNASQNSSSYKPIAKYQQGYDENSSEQYYEGILYINWSPGYKYGSYAQRAANDYALGKSSFKEPTLITGSTQNYSWRSVAGGQYDAQYYTQLSGLGITSPTSMGQYLNNSFTKTVQSIKQYGGFYVGRYETSIFTKAGASNYSQGTVIGSKENQTPMASVNWYKMYLTQDSNYENNPYNGNTNISTQMITGSEYDAVLNYILTGSDASKVYAVTGNHTGARSTTGQFGSDIMSNIFDLSSNVREWTTEGVEASYRVDRGGDYGIGNTNPAYSRNYDFPTAYGLIGSRVALLIQ